MRRYFALALVLIALSSRASATYIPPFTALQIVTCTIATNALSCTVTPSPTITLAQTLIFDQGAIGTESNGTPDRLWVRHELTNATTYTCYRGAQGSTGTRVCQAQLLTLNAQWASVQHSSCSPAATTTCDATIAAVTIARSVVLFLGANVTGPNSAASYNYPNTCTLTTTTNVHCNAVQTTTGTIGFDVLSFN